MIDYLKPLQELFKANRNENDAAAMAAYMKGHFSYFGIKPTKRRELQKQFLNEQGLPEPIDKRVFHQ